MWVCRGSEVAAVAFYNNGGSVGKCRGFPILSFKKENTLYLPPRVASHQHTKKGCSLGAAFCEGVSWPAARG